MSTDNDWLNLRVQALEGRVSGLMWVVATNLVSTSLLLALILMG